MIPKHASALLGNMPARGPAPPVPVGQHLRSLDVGQHAGPGQSFTFYATFDADSLCSYIPEGTPLLLPASSWARKGLSTPCVPPQVYNKAADSGGYVASFFNNGQYTYTLSQYVQWNRRWSPLWAATMDLCCEHELGVLTEQRQQQTTDNAWEAWTYYKQESWAWVPTIQGRLPEDYRRHALTLLPLIQDMQAYYANNPYWRVGVGTLCRRNDVVIIEAILNAVREVLPPTIPLFLWGMKLDALRSISLHQVIGSDSAVWHGAMYARNDIAAAAAALNMSMRAYRVKVNLPAYIAKVYAAVEESYRITAAQRNQDAITRTRSLLHAHGWTLHIRTRRNRTYAYAARRIGSHIESRYLCPVSALDTWLASSSPAIPGPSPCPTPTQQGNELVYCPTQKELPL